MKLREVIVLLIIIKLATSQSVYSNSSANSTSKYGEKRFDEWTWLTAHNSHLNWPDSSVIYIASNQNLSIDEQLKYGVRGFMFDVDYHKCSHLSSLLNSCNCEGVCLCHGQCSSNSLKDGFAIKSLGYALRKLVNFLTKNKEEIITVFLEDYIQTTTQLTNVFDRIKNLNRMIFNPYESEWNVLEKGWPKIADMVKANKRLLIIDDEQRAYHVNRLNGIIRSRDYLIQNHYEWLVENKTILPLPSTSSLKDISKLAIEDPKHFLIHLAHMNKTLSIPIAKCVSVHNVNRRPNWGETHKLNLTSREHPNQLLNGQKLFLFNHFYGVPAKGAVEGNLHLYEYINSREFVEKRLREKCDPNTSRKRPNYIALDFIEEQTFDNLVSHFNTNKY